MKNGENRFSPRRRRSIAWWNKGGLATICWHCGADSYKVEENGAKPLIFHECGKIPTVEQLEKTPWCSFMTWHTEWLIDENTKDELSEIYNSDYAVTLDKLPDFAI